MDEVSQCDRRKLSSNYWKQCTVRTIFCSVYCQLISTNLCSTSFTIIYHPGPCRGSCTTILFLSAQFLFSCFATSFLSGVHYHICQQRGSIWHIPVVLRHVWYSCMRLSGWRGTSNLYKIEDVTDYQLYSQNCDDHADDVWWCMMTHDDA